jgi:glycosyltransferase involved in cell wall biosynthesis
MSRIILDCNLMRHRDSGLYHYCLNLGVYVNRALREAGSGAIAYYVPPAESNTFEDTRLCIAERKWHHRFFRPYLWNCDIWHAPFQSGRIVPMHNRRIKVLLTIHDLNCLHEDKTAKERRLSLNHTQQLIDRADAIVCISHHCKKDVLDNLDTAKTPIHVIHNGTHQVASSPEKPKGYLPTRPFLFAMGYVNRKKNFHTLVPLLENNELELLVAGKLDEPDYVTAMQRDAENLGVADRLTITGPVPESDKAWYYQHCAAFMLPSLAEGFGAPVVEAMAFGKPLFLSDRTSLPEIGGDVAFYFNNFEPAHMQHILNEGLAEYQKNGLAQRIIQRGTQFCWEEKAREYLQVYQSLLPQNTVL